MWICFEYNLKVNYVAKVMCSIIYFEGMRV